VFNPNFWGDDYYGDDFWGEDTSLVSMQDESTIGVYRTEHYECDRCGSHYPRKMVVVQNGMVVCRGRGTNNCMDKPGFTAHFNRKPIRVEEPPRPLPVRSEDL
jgi:hypothetical protein